MKEKTTRPSSAFFARRPSLPLPHYSEEGMIGTMEGVISQADARAGHGAGNPRSSTETSNKYPATSGKSIQMFQTYSQVVLAARVCQAQMDNAGSLYHQLFGNGYRTGSLPVMHMQERCVFQEVSSQAGCTADSCFSPEEEHARDGHD
jgi:hypothetical protein